VYLAEKVKKFNFLSSPFVGSEVNIIEEPFWQDDIPTCYLCIQINLWFGCLCCGL